jgi:hypothetical protein
MDEFSVEEPRYTRIVAAQLAEISLEFLERCETERLVRVRVIRGGVPGYSARDIRDLARIGRLREQLELDFPALEVVLHMRRQVLGLREQMERLEQEMVRREERLLRELAALRRLVAEETDRS